MAFQDSQDSNGAFFATKYEYIASKTKFRIEL